MHTIKIVLHILHLASFVQSLGKVLHQEIAPPAFLALDLVLLGQHHKLLLHLLPVLLQVIDVHLQLLIIDALLLLVLVPLQVAFGHAFVHLLLIRVDG